jgi:hypothetical protein
MKYALTAFLSFEVSMNDNYIQYLEKRFDKSLRVCVSISVFVTMVLIYFLTL